MGKMNLINLLKSYSIETLSDAMDMLHIDGVITGFMPISKQKKAVGKAYTIKFCRDVPEKCVAADYIDDVGSENVIVIDNNDISECTVWGDILTQKALISKIQGTIIYGAVRDYSFNSKSRYPLFARNIHCKTGKGIVRLEFIQQDIVIQGIKISPDDYIVVENGIVLVIPKGSIGKVLDYAKQIEYCEMMIIKEIKKGNSLKEARQKYNYNEFK